MKKLLIKSAAILLALAAVAVVLAVKIRPDSVSINPYKEITYYPSLPDTTLAEK